MIVCTTSYLENPPQPHNIMFSHPISRQLFHLNNLLGSFSIFSLWNTSQSFSLSRSLSYRSNPWASHQMHFFIIHRDFVVCRCGESAPPSHSHSAKQQSISWPTDNGEIILRTCDTCKWVTLNLIKLYVKVKSNKTPRLLCSTWLNNSPPARDSAGLHIMMPVGYRKAI